MNKRRAQSSKSVPTRERILDAAEEIIAAKGYSAASIREISRKAGSDLGSFTYYFPTKDFMFSEVVRRRADELDKATCSALDDLLDNNTPTLEGLIVALVQPLFDRMSNHGDGWRNYIQLVASMISNSKDGDLDHVQIVYQNHHGTKKFIDAVSTLLPEAAEEEIFLFYLFLNSITLNIFQKSAMIEAVSGGKIKITDVEAIMKFLPAFCAGGLRAMLGGNLGNDNPVEKKTPGKKRIGVRAKSTSVDKTRAARGKLA